MSESKPQTKHSQSKKATSKKYKVQFYTKKLRTWVLPLLNQIKAENYPTKAGKTIGLSRQHTHYYIKKLEKANLIYKNKRSNITLYQLTTKGQNLLKSCEGKVYPSNLYRLDKCMVSYLILKQGHYPMEDFRRVEMVNWTALLGLEVGVKVRHTGKSWIVHVPVVCGRSPAQVYGSALNLGNRVAVSLAKKYGVVLAEGKIVAGELAVEDPVAGLFGRYFMVRTEKRKVDHSWGKGELENMGRDAVVDYLQMPERVRRVEREVERLACSLDRLAEVLGYVADSSSKGAVEGQRKLGEYVK